MALPAGSRALPRGKYHNQREFVALAGKLGLARRQRPHPVISFSDVQLTEHTVANYADTLASPGAAIRLYRDTFRRLGLLEAKTRAKRAEKPFRTPMDSSPRARRRAVQGHLRLPAAPVVLDPRQAMHARGPITCGVSGQDYQP